MQSDWILASDIDNTLTGNAEALDKLRKHVASLRAQGKLLLILSTGRRLDQVLDGMETEGLPKADAIISQVGTEIYLPPFTVDADPLPAWDARLKRDYSRRRALQFLEDIEGLKMQPDRFNTPLKVSCYLDDTPDPDAAAARIRRRVAEAGADDQYCVVWSSGRDLDILPAAAGKGKAIRFLLDYWQRPSKNVVVAGDSGNDRAMFDEFEYGIVVGNAQPELKQLRDENPPPTFYFAQQSHAAGVAEGLRHFGILPQS